MRSGRRVRFSGPGSSSPGWRARAGSCACVYRSKRGLSRPQDSSTVERRTYKPLVAGSTPALAPRLAAGLTMKVRLRPRARRPSGPSQEVTGNDTEVGATARVRLCAVGNRGVGSGRCAPALTPRRHRDPHRPALLARGGTPVFWGQTPMGSDPACRRRRRRVAT